MVGMIWTWEASRARALLINSSLIFTATAVTVIYLHIRDPTFHQVAYAILTALVLLRSIFLMLTRIDDIEAKKNMTRSIVIGVTSFATGFVLWTIDNEYCDALRNFRNQIGFPWAFFLGISAL